MAPGQPGLTNHGDPAAGWATSVVVALSDVLPGCVTSADMENERWTEGDLSAALIGIPVDVPTVRPDSRPRDAQPSTPPNRHPTEDEQGISAKFSEVKGDGATPVTAPAVEGAHHHTTTPAPAPAPMPTLAPLPPASARNRRLLARNHQQEFSLL